MRIRSLITVALIVSVAVPGAARASCERACKIDAANRYLASLVSHDASDVPLHPDAWRTENGTRLDGGENIREANESAIMYVISGIRELRWYGEGDDVIALYFLDTFAAPTYIAERFLVDDDGLIREIEAAFLIDFVGYYAGPESIASRPDGQVERATASQHGPLGPVPVQDGEVGDADARGVSSCARACVEAAALAWIDAMVIGDASGVPMDDAVSVTVNRRRIADAREPAAAYVASTGLDAHQTDPRVYVDGEQAVAFYELDADGSLMYAATRFRVVDGAIAEVEGFCDLNPTCSEGGPPF